MKFFSLLITVFTVCILHVAIAQTIKLTAVYDANNSAVKLNWNMVNSTARTGYLLLKSTDGISWTEAAKDRMLRTYTEDDIYIFADRYFTAGRNYYRIKIADAYNNTIALSPVVIVNTSATIQTAKTPTPVKPQNSIQQQTQTINKTQGTATSANNSWIIYPNPATDLLKLAYKGSAELKGVVNVQI